MTEEKINDLIFKELLKRGYSQRGKTRVWNIADSKLWYLTPEQAQGYLDLEKTTQYSKTVNVQGENLVEDHIKEIIKQVGEGPLNIVDLGCGDGRKAAHIIDHFKEKTKIRYCPIDISGYMVQKAIETVSKIKLNEIIDSKYNISDFENLENLTPLLTKGEYKKNFFLLLGNTLGNFEINELLYEIRSGMNKGDHLLIGTGIDDKKNEARAEAYKNNKMSYKFLLHIPLQLGLKESDLEHGARFNHSRIELYFTLKKNKTIKFLEKEVEFEKGDEIVVLVAYKHELDNLKMYLNMHFDRVEVWPSEEGSTALALCYK